MLEGKTIGFIGGGNMAEALVTGIINGGAVAPSAVLVSEPHPPRATYLNDTYGIEVTSARDLAQRCDIVVFAVKPQIVGEVLVDLGGHIRDGALVISVAAGVPAATFEAALPGAPVVRVMPNTPALVGEGMSVICAGTAATDVHLALARSILATAGKVSELPESALDAVTALSGSGPAYFFYLVEALIDAGEQVGLSRADATELVVQTAYGAATMLRDSGRSAADLRAAVTSPGGTTAAGIAVFDEANTREVVAQVVAAANARSAELGRG